MLGARPKPEMQVAKIAVLRANGIGDFMFSIPALQALRTTYPNAEITLLALGWHKRFLASRPAPVDRVIVVPRSRGIREEPGADESAAELNDFFDAMRREHFDIAIQLHGGGRNSNPFVLRLGSRLTVGMRSADAPALGLWIPYIYFHPEVLRYLEVVSLIGARPVNLEPRVFVTEEDVVEAASIVPLTEGPLVALHPGAGDPRRRWPAEKFAYVGDGLAEAGARIVVIGTDREQAITETVVERMQARAQNVCSRLSLGGLAGLLSRCALVISNDSGPLHLAGAVGASTVGIFWCVNLVNGGPVTRTRHRQAISWQVTCPLCGAEAVDSDCEHSCSFVECVPTHRVLGMAFDLLAS